MRSERHGTRAITIVFLAMFFCTAYAADDLRVTERDKDFVRVQRDRMRSSPEYRRAVRSVDELEARLKGERKVPFDPVLHPLQFREPELPLTINPALRRTLQPNAAIIVFDITGSGRVTGQQLISSGPYRQWGEEALKMVGDWLFEPVVEGDIGVTRVGVTAAVYAELQGAGMSCGAMKVQNAADLESRVCARVKAPP